MKRLIAYTTLFALTACTTTDPYTGEKKTSSATTGAVVGAIAGAAVGMASASKNDREKGVVTGALAGGAIGGGIGLYQDRQEAALKQQLEGSGVQVQREGDTISLIMPGNITFATDQYTIRSEFHSVLSSVATVLSEYQKTNVKITGHTDSTGSSQYNQLLSERRAQSVKEYLAQQGVSYSRLRSEGYASRYPIASNASSSGRAQNRRVEIDLIPQS
ncbi:OmpA family protein [Gilvimarinus agarilyticus]|uniref:OmpA family protein n=1 Tax=unclassified Gilvimarinus TaxID=2642066 RepID=UPI001C096E5C|nr:MULTISPECIES: OmpA family protein [unclassified Gilvimarinus]MBU2885025.1 OmpA family protein [Gilvimarinus agarilyticus]MDO6569922.1 OmpA family protein [Gilvimarinus sp. 2_MG-2023]MDO6747131.1 OmpA family protein [Gilvimarinus sp. 1_MG-2023]